MSSWKASCRPARWGVAICDDVGGISGMMSTLGIFYGFTLLVLRMPWVKPYLSTTGLKGQKFILSQLWT